MHAENILLERVERPLSVGGDAIEPDALSYSKVIHAWCVDAVEILDMDHHHSPTDRESVPLPMKNEFTKQQLKSLISE